LFNVLCHDPAIVAVSFLSHPSGRTKDTGNNILSTRQFVINVVPEGLAEAMNLSCIDAPPEIDEAALSRLETSPSVVISPPRLSKSPVALECELESTLSFSASQITIFGRVVHATVADEFVQDPDKCIMDGAKLGLIGAMHAAKWYSRPSDLFAMDRPTWASRRS
jgi:flavin reductase (DIM6/NTAB) family NADH-FMN oxidoreductase RutF